MQQCQMWIIWSLLEGVIFCLKFGHNCGSISCCIISNTIKEWFWFTVCLSGTNSWWTKPHILERTLDFCVISFQCFIIKMIKHAVCHLSNTGMVIFKKYIHTSNVFVNWRSRTFRTGRLIDDILPSLERLWSS